MYRRPLLAALALLPLLAVLLTLPRPALAEKEGPAYAAHDFILAIDVSGSMVVDTREGNASDPQGIRWDGLQFLLDTARPDDRVSLVLFCGDAAVPSLFLDKSGFLTMAKEYDSPAGGKVSGRQRLKDLVRELQEREARIGRELRERPSGDAVNRFLTYDDLKMLGGKKFTLFSYTSVVETLNTITRKSRLLDALEPDRPAWLLLFTDGLDDVNVDKLEFAEKGHQFKVGKGDYAYLPRLQVRERGKRDEERRKLAAELVEPLKKKQVRAFTFALGGSCDERFLRAITEQANPTGKGSARQRIGAYYNPRDNVELLERLQQVCWELRQYWVLTPRPERAAGQDRFWLPEPRPWLDLGVLLYRDIGRGARAPREKDVALWQGGKGVEGLSPLASRSHLYYPFGERDRAPARQKLTADERLEVRVERGEGDVKACKCVGVFRTDRPLFVPLEPAAGSAWSPLDAIPFLVEFRPYDVGGRYPFESSQFEVTASLLPVGGSKGREERRIKLEPDKDVAPGKPVLFRGEVILDPESKGRKDELLGTYEVEVTIKGVSGPLAGADRHLIRSTIRVDEYPDLHLPQRRIVLSNQARGSLRAAAAVEVQLKNLGSKPERVVASLSPALTGTWKHAGSGREIEARQAKVSPSTVPLRGGKGAVEVELPGSALSRLPVGTYEGGQLTLTAPWGKPAAGSGVDVVVDKGRYALKAPAEVVLDLSARNEEKVPRTIEARLATNLDTDEEVWISESKDGPAVAGQRELSFQPATKGGKPVKVPAFDLGKKGVVKSAGGDGLTLALQRPRGGLPAGWYTRKLYLVGEAVEPHELTVKVKVDQPVVFLTGERGSPARRIDQLSFLALAGRTFRCALQVRTELEGDTPPALYSQLAGRLKEKARLPRVGGGDELEMEVEPADDRLWLNLKVPASVREGQYLTRLALDLSGEKEGAAAPLLLDLPVAVQVAHFAVAPRQTGSLKLQVGNDPELKVTRPLTLTTTAEPGQVVRWSVTRVPQPAAGLFKPLEPSRIDVLYNDRSVVQDKDKEGPGGPSNPLTPGEKATLTLAVRCAGLAPGYYHAGLLFRSSANDQPLMVEGFAEQVTVEVLVPGREVQASVEPGSTPVMGKPADLRVRVRGFGCEPGAGEVWPADEQGKPVGAAVAIDAARLVKGTAPEQVPEGVKTAEYVVAVTPTRAGRNTFVVSWPRYLPANKAEAAPVELPQAPADRINVPVSLDAVGELRVEPRMAAVGEEAVVQAVVDPSSLKGAGSLALRGTRPDGQELTLDLVSGSKPGTYTGRYKLDWPGTYALTGATGGVRVEPAKMRAAFELENTTRYAAMLYGLGEGMRWIMPLHSNLERASLKNVVRLTNKEGERCEWEARLLYPRQEHVSRNILQQGDLSAVEVGPFDEERHLAGKLLLQDTEGATEELSETHKKGVLKNGQTLALGVDTELSADAVDHVYNNKPGQHQTLDQVNGMLVEVTLRWLDDEGKEVGTRTVRVPVAVQTKYWGWQGFWWVAGELGLAVVLLLVAWRVWRYFFPRQPRLAPAAARPPSGAAEAPPQAAPRPEPAPSRPKRIRGLD